MPETLSDLPTASLPELGARLSLFPAFTLLAVILFGSLATGEFTQHSDADVAVIFATPVDWMKLYRCSSGRVQPLVYPAEQFLQMINKANGLALEVCHDVGYSRASPPTSASSKIPLPKSSIVTAWKKPKLAGCCKTAADPVTCWRRVAAQPKTEEIVRESGELTANF